MFNNNLKLFHRIRKARIIKEPYKFTMIYPLAVFAVLLYGCVEVGFAFTGFNEPHELSRSTFNLGNRFPELGENIERPCGRDGVNTDQLGKNFTMEDSGGINEILSFLEFALNDAIQKISNQDGENDEAKFFYYVHIITVLCCLAPFFLNT